MLGFIIKDYKSFTKLSVLKMLCYFVVRPKMEYESVVWYPYYITHKIFFESMLRKLCTFCTFKADNKFSTVPDHSVLQFNKTNEYLYSQQKMFVYKVFDMHYIILDHERKLLKIEKPTVRESYFG